MKRNAVLISNSQKAKHVHIACCVCSGLVYLSGNEGEKFFAGYRKGALIFGSFGLCINTALLIVTLSIFE